MLRKLKNSLFIGIVATLVGVCAVNVCAKEIILGDEEMTGIYSGSRLKDSCWGNADGKGAYMTGAEWASVWGAEGWMTDTEDSGVLCHSKPGIAVGENAQIRHIIKRDELPDNTTIVAEFDFKTVPQMTNGNTEIWFNVVGSKTVQLVNVSLSSANGVVAKFASTTAHPFTETVFDRKSGLTLDWDKDYKIVVTMTPNKNSEQYQYIAELYDGTGAKLGAGIIQHYGAVDSGTFKLPNAMGFWIVSQQTVDEVIPAIYLKNMKVTAITDAIKPEASFVPKNGAEAVDPEGEFKVEFGEEIEGISIQDVEISGNAVVADVIMNNASTGAEIVFDGLDYGESYKIKINNVMPKGSEATYSYEWSFSTKNVLSFSKIYSDTEAVMPYYFDFTTLTGADVTDDKESDAYNLNNKLYTNSITDFDFISGVTEDGIGFSTVAPNAQYEVHTYKKIAVPQFENNALLTSDLIICGDWRANVSKAFLDFKTSLGTSYRFLACDGSQYNANTEVRLLGGSTRYALSGRKAYKLEVSFSLNGSMYDATVKLLNEDGTLVATEDRASFISKADLLALSEICFISSASASDGNKGAADMLRVKNIKIEAVGGSLYQQGTNTIKIDYVNENPGQAGAADFLVITERLAADGVTYKMEKIDVISRDDLSLAEGTVSLDITIENPENIRLRVYVLSSIEKMIPLAEEGVR